MDSLEKAADLVARDFLNPGAPLFDVTLAKNALLDCLFSSDEPDFIRKMCDHPLHRSDARRVFGKMAPHLVALAGRTAQECRA